MPDLIFCNGTVLTMNSGAPRAAALAVRGTRILAVGSEAEVRVHAADDAVTVDLRGRCLLPGFHDSHLHLTQHGFELAQVTLHDAMTQEEGLRRVAARAYELPAESWILGAGFLMARWNVAELHKRDLDRVAPHQPVFLRSQDHHSAWVNTKALELAHITASTPQPENGEIVKDDQGEPTGLLLEHAAGLVWDALPVPTDADIQEALEAAGRDLARLGITTVHHMAAEPASYWRNIALQASQESYPLRVWACIDQVNIEHAAAVGVATGQGGEFFQTGGAKFFADGALGSLTAHMLEPYEGTTTTGMPVHGLETMLERFPLAIAAGLVPVTHAIGDAAVRAVLDALAATQDLWQPRGMRPRVEHAQHLHKDDIGRFASLGVIASVQPIHFRFDAKRTSEILGERLHTTHAWRSLLSAGTRLALGSDTPVAGPNVLEGLKTALSRASETGEVFTPSEVMTLDEALAGYTRDAAYAISWEHRSGQLKPGYDADLVVLSHSPHEGLDGLEVTGTMKAGRWTYEGG